MADFIPLSVPNLRGNELEYVTRAIQTEWVSTGGPDISAFEEDMARYVKSRCAAVQSGTAGLHLALLAGGVGPGQEVLVPTLTFIAAVNPIRYAGATPVFMDCDDTLCLDVDKVEAFCREQCRFLDGKLINKESGAHVAAVLAVHVFGNLADMERLMDLAGEFGLFVVEDATESLGSYYLEGRYAGRYSGTIGHMGVYSFNGNKIITTGGGGMVVSADTSLLEKARYLSTQAKNDALYFIHNEIGYNYRMTNLQAALGVAQLEQLEGFISHKKASYDRYRSQGIPLHPFREDIRPNYWFYSYLTNRRDELIRYLEENKVQSRPIWHLIHELPPYRDCQNYRIEKATFYWERVVNIPCSTNLSPRDVDRVAGLLHKFE